MLYVHTHTHTHLGEDTDPDGQPNPGDLEYISNVSRDTYMYLEGSRGPSFSSMSPTVYPRRDWVWGGEVADLADLADGSCPIPSATRTRASDPVQLQVGGSSLNLSGCQICKCKVQARPQFQLRQHSTERGGKG